MQVETLLSALSALTQRTRGASLREQRDEWASRIRAPVFNHPKQLAFVSSPARLKATSSNRRGGKTEGVGRWDAADLIDNDGELIWVFSETLEQYSANWLTRTPGPSMLDLLEDVGLVEGTHYTVSRYDRKIIRSISFAWGSQLRVLSSADSTKLEKPRGGRPTKIRADEVQKMPHLQAIIAKVVAAASADFDASVLLTGTPGADVDTYFHEIASGRKSNWEVHHLYSCDNPFFGSSWRDRYEKSVLSRLRVFQEDFGINDEQMEVLEELSNEDYTCIARSEIAEMPERLAWLIRTLNPDCLREFFGRWVAEESEYVFTSIRQVPEATLYWNTYAESIGKQARGEGRPSDFFSEIESWSKRAEELPSVKTHQGERKKKWSAVIGGDFGFFPDPFALWCGVLSPEHHSLLEFSACKATRMTEPEQFSALSSWAKALRDLGISVSAIVLDAGGAEGMPVVKGWLDRLRDSLSNPHLLVEAAAKANSWTQRFQINSEIRGGRIQLLRRSPTVVEGLYLKRIPPNPEKNKLKPSTAKHRRVEVDGASFVPGDHCLDAMRYAWYWCIHHWSVLHTEDSYIDPLTAMSLAMERSELDP